MTDALPDCTPTSLWMADEWRAASAGRRFPVENPADGRVLAQVADAEVADAIAAMDAAVAAQAGWAATPPRTRSEILSRAHAAMIADETRLATLMTLEMGKALAEARGEVRYAAEFLRWFAEEAVRIDGRYATAPDGGSRLLTVRQPVGPCVLVAPWNFPLAMGARKIGPALAAGCTCVVKPAPQTPLSMLALAALLHEAGLPPGVLGVLPTTRAQEVVAACLDHPGARKLSFTGSTAVGRRLAEHAGRRLLRTSLELGGDNPFIVFGDADLDAAVEGAMLAKLRNVGEACTAANRFLVQVGVAEVFSARLAARMAAQTVGPGLSGAEVGPLIDGAARAKVARLVEAAVAGGARLLAGGTVPDGPGWFYPPTVLADVPDDAEIGRTEIFGPVAVVRTFADEADALARANDSPLGLAAYVFTRDLARALRVVDRLEVGMVGLNRGLVSNPAAPFGGVKASGLGREGGAEGIDEYLSVKYAALAL